MNDDHRNRGLVKLSFSMIRRRCIQGLVLPVAVPMSPAWAAPVQSREKQLAAFDGVRTSVPAEVTIRIGSPPRIVMSAEPSVLDVLEAEVSGRIMTLRATASFKTRERVSIEIQTPDLKTLDIGGAVNVTLESLQAERLEVKAGDSASVTLDRLKLQRLSLVLDGSAQAQGSGEAASQELTFKGSSSFDGKDLESRDVKVSARDASSASLSVDRKLDAVLTDAAHVEYAGSPKIVDSVSGAASLDQI